MTSAMQESAPTGVNGAPRTGDQLQGAASGLLDQATRTADAQASTTMTRVGQTLDDVARSIEDAASGMRESQPDVANLVATAADRVSEAATYLRDHTASDALDTAQRLARRQPAAIVGGGLVLGLVLGRVLRTGAAIAQSDMESPTANQLAATDAAVDATFLEDDFEPAGTTTKTTRRTRSSGGSR